MNSSEEIEMMQKMIEENDRNMAKLVEECAYRQSQVEALSLQNIALKNYIKNKKKGADT